MGSREASSGSGHPVLGESPGHRLRSPRCQTRCPCALCAARGLKTVVSAGRNFRVPGGWGPQEAGSGRGRGRGGRAAQGGGGGGASRFPRQPARGVRRAARPVPGAAGNAGSASPEPSTACRADGAAANCWLRRCGRRRKKHKSYFKHKSQAVGHSHKEY